jgi:hypothetical protein
VGITWNMSSRQGLTTLLRPPNSTLLDLRRFELRALESEKVRKYDEMLEIANEKVKEIQARLEISIRDTSARLYEESKSGNDLCKEQGHEDSSKRNTTSINRAGEGEKYFSEPNRREQMRAEGSLYAS